MSAQVISRLDVYPETARVADQYGRIVREVEYWCVSYTVTEPGYRDRYFCPTFTSEDSAQAHVEKLRARGLLAVGL